MVYARRWQSFRERFAALRAAVASEREREREREGRVEGGREEGERESEKEREREKEGEEEKIESEGEQREEESERARKKESAGGGGRGERARERERGRGRGGGREAGGGSGGGRGSEGGLELLGGRGEGAGGGSRSRSAGWSERACSALDACLRQWETAETSDASPFRTSHTRVTQASDLMSEEPLLRSSSERVRLAEVWELLVVLPWAFSLEQGAEKVLCVCVCVCVIYMRLREGLCMCVCVYVCVCVCVFYMRTDRSIYTALSKLLLIKKKPAGAGFGADGAGVSGLPPGAPRAAAARTKACM